MKKLLNLGGKYLDFMGKHDIFICGTYATAVLLWLLENKLKGNS